MELFKPCHRVHPVAQGIALGFELAVHLTEVCFKSTYNLRWHQEGTRFLDRQWPSAAFLNCMILCCRTCKGTVLCAAISCRTSNAPGISSSSFSRVADLCTRAGSWDAAPLTTLYNSSGETVSDRAEFAWFMVWMTPQLRRQQLHNSDGEDRKG